MKGSADGEADEAERKQDQPDQGIEHKREEGEGPAGEEEDREEKKFYHRACSVWLRPIADVRLPPSGTQVCRDWFRRDRGVDDRIDFWLRETSP